MAVPTNKSQFKEFCLRALGKTAIDINITDEQADDRIDFALRTFYDFNFEGSERSYFKYQVTPNNHSTAIYDLTIDNGGIGYTNGDVLTFSNTGAGRDAEGTVTTDANGTITSLDYTNGRDFANPPTVGVTTSTGSNASITAQLGGFIPIPDNIIGITGIFDVGITSSSSNLFNWKYQMILSDLYMFENLNIVPYYIAMQNISLIQEVLVGKQPLRFNQYTNKLFIDMDWTIVNEGTFIVVEAYAIIDAATYSEVWRNRWLQQYATCLLKMQWGNNLKKYTGMPLVGGITFNGQQIYDEAVAEEKELMYELRNTYSLPQGMYVG